VTLGDSRNEEVGVDVDDVTIVIALLSLLTQDLQPEDPVLGVAERVAERLRADIVSLVPSEAGTISRMRRPPSS
jgi:hypothetical protein